MAKQQLLGVFEECLMLAILKLGNNAYSVSIAETIEEASGKEVTMGALFTTLGRLEEKSFVTSRLGDPGYEKKGKPRRYYQVESAGREALRETHEIKSRLQIGGLIPAMS